MGKGKKRGGGGGKHKQKMAGGGAASSKKGSPAAVMKKPGSNSNFPVCGLMNLGNTCFFNSVMQGLGQTEYLRCRLDTLVNCPQSQRLTLRAEEKELEVVVSEAPGQLTKTLHAFMKDMATPTGRTLNPRPLFSQICEKAPRFRGFQQQDSQELLRYLLDSIKMEEAHRIKRGILLAFNVTSGKMTSQVPKREQELIKMYREPTYVDDVFGGVLVSTITCSECHNCSTIHESYLDLSLPIHKDEVSRGERHQKRERGVKEMTPGDVQGEGEGVGVKGGEGGVAMKEEVSMSKHQMKKARKKTRKGKVVKQSLQDLHSMMNEAQRKREMDAAVEREGLTAEKEEEVGGDERRCGGGEGDEGRCGGGEGDGEGVEGEPVRPTVDEKEGEKLAEDTGARQEDTEADIEKQEDTEADIEKQEDTEADIEKQEDTEADIEKQEDTEADIEKEDDTEAKGPPAAIATEDKEEEVEKKEENVCDHVGSTELNKNTVSKAGNTAENGHSESTDPNGRVKPTHPDVELPAEDAVAVETTTDASPRQPKQATPPSNEPSSTATDIAYDDELNPLTSVQFKEGSLEACLKKFCSEEVLSGINQFFCSVCTQRRAQETSAETSTAENSCKKNCEQKVESPANEEQRDSLENEENSGSLGNEGEREVSVEEVSQLPRPTEEDCQSVNEGEKESLANEENGGSLGNEGERESLANEENGGSLGNEGLANEENGGNEGERESLANEENSGSLGNEGEREVSVEEVSQLPRPTEEDCQLETDQPNVSREVMKDCSSMAGCGGVFNGPTTNGPNTATEQCVLNGAVETVVEGEGERGEMCDGGRLGGGEVNGDRDGSDSGESVRDGRSVNSCESPKESDCEGNAATPDIITTELTPEKEEKELTHEKKEKESSSTSSSQKEELVFRDATKQLLIESLPPVLTLHMKRFLQEGRRLRKNGCHVDFPDILDMAPFCVPNCKVPRDDSGRILYSLYAVVEHAGGMQGGHYTAYVRVRNSHTHFTDVGGVNDHAVGQEERGVALPVTTVASVGACTASSTTEDQRSTTVDQRSTTMDQTGTTVDHTGNTADHPSSTNDNHHATSEPNQSTTNCDQSDTTRDQTFAGATPEPLHTTGDQTEAKSQPHTHKLDHSSTTSGQWHHISDTHVRTATETEVHKSQAYLLFYERLNYQSS